jgi:ribosomal protein S18 acetylase RimI-like enzyme
LLGHIYVGAYLALEPDLAWLLEDDEGVCGYVLGALRSREFFQRYATEWLPPLQAQIARPVGDPATLSPTDQLRWLIHEPDLFCPEPYAEFPAHLHIDLLPRAQGQGWGRRMMAALLERLATRGAPGVHLGMHASNTRAAEFYRRMGFHELVQVADSWYFGKRFTGGT